LYHIKSIRQVASFHGKRKKGETQWDKKVHVDRNEKFTAAINCQAGSIIKR
jgi:hypothetical protein